MKLADYEMAEAVQTNPNLCVPWYLTAAYLYYICDVSILSDEAFDELARFMLEEWGAIEHWHKHLITEDDLRAGTLLRRDFPQRVIGAATFKLQQLREAA